MRMNIRTRKGEEVRGRRKRRSEMRRRREEIRTKWRRKKGSIRLMQKKGARIAGRENRGE
jgi:hypothetical protein